MSSSKRPREDNTPGPPPKKGNITRRVAIDPAKASLRASSLRVLSNGRVGSKKLSLREENLTPIAPDTTAGNFPASPNDSEGVDVDSVPGVMEKQQGQGAERKKKVDTNSSKLTEWLEFRESFLLEIIRHYGTGDSSLSNECACCHSEIGRFRCLDCFPRLMKCSRCLVNSHQENPLHRVEEWNGTFFEKRRLKDLGLRIQLGHGGRACPLPAAASADFIVLHINGLHRVAVNFCNCGNLNRPSPHPRVQILRMAWFPATFDRPKTAFTFDLLHLFHKITLQGKTTLYDFYHAILQVGDTLQLDETVNRYSEFNRSFRIWRHLSSLKHSGRGHDPAGAARTSEGELVMECPACPHPGKNLPDDWEDARPEDRFLYTFFMAVDANFKLKQKNRGISDIELAPGWGCYVESSRYDKHVELHTNESDLNSCESDHNAIARANTAVPGYAVNAVGLGLCSRHSLVRGNGVVDLRKGEKFCSMDYLVLSALAGVNVSRVVVSYDIGCQWAKNLYRRIEKYPDQLKLSDDIQLEIGIPSWHVNGHGSFCRNNYSLSYMPGVGRTCGEDVEISWSQTNSLAPSTREMASGSRKETLNDHWNGWNLRKVVGFRTLFLKRFKDACVMRKKHVETYQTFTGTFKVKTIEAWTKMVEDWMRDRTKPNPYEEPTNTTTLQDVRLELAKEDAEAASAGICSVHKVSLTEFLTKGLELEEQQRVLQYDVARIKGKLSSKESADLQEKRNTLYHRIHQWRDAQLAYTPIIAPLLLKQTSPLDTVTMLIEETPLFLPSSLPITLRNSIQNIASKELRLRKAQAAEALEDIRRGRRMITGLSQFKKLNICGAGNKANTRMRTLYDRLQTRILRASNRYRAARDALEQLEPDGMWTAQFRLLNTDDIRGPGRQADDPVQIKKHRFEQSWIWTVGYSIGKETTEEEFDDTMRAEWAKIRARRDRWEEEYRLVLEEMRRTVAYLRWKAQWWRDQAFRRIDTDDIVGQGLKAYAMRQAYVLESLAFSCVTKWVPALSAEGIAPIWITDQMSHLQVERSEDMSDEDEDMEDNEQDNEDNFID